MKNRIFFPNLDGLRFIAFFLVFWQHATPGLFLLLKNKGLFDDSQARFFMTGGIGVSFFFVLSGFLITFLLLREREETGKIDIKAFYARRILRIFPLYYLVVFWGFAIYPLIRVLLKFEPIDNGNFLIYFFFLGNFDVIYAAIERSSFIAITWSVGIEEQFYIFWALLFLLLPKRLYKYIFPIIIIGSSIFRLLNENNEKILYFHTLSVVSDLAIGGGMAYLAINRPGFINFIASLKKRVIALIYGFGFTLIWFYPSIFWLDTSNALYRICTGLFFAFVIAEQNYAANSFFKMGNLKIVSKLGIYTYGLYLLHPIALYFMEILLKGLHLEEDGIAYIAANGVIGLILSILISYISYKFYESKFLRLKKYFNPKEKILIKS